MVGSVDPGQDRVGDLLRYWAYAAGVGKKGYSVVGFDRSVAMLEQARRRLGPEVALIHAELPEIPVNQQFDAVISAAAGFNYMSNENDLAKTFQQVARTVRPGGSGLYFKFREA
ncbi:MAG: class I SAM-dependent methyltransferase [Pseudonocardiaceae bacterium]